MTSKFKQLCAAYHAYLLRCWTTPARPNNGTPGQQRFVVETVTGQPRRRGFDSLAGLLIFLQDELAVNNEPLNNDLPATSGRAG